MTVSQQQLELAFLLEQAGKIVALTGAGISTAAGIPDFRGPKGLYVTRRYDPDRTFDIRGFERDPEDFYRFAADFIALLANTRPTFAHGFLAHLEDAGKLSAVITQNIDMLHQAAGSSKVIELHGSFCSAACRACGKGYSSLDVHWWQHAIAAHSDKAQAVCPNCAGVIKPDIVFFGEPVDKYAEAERVVRECDLLLVLGTSLTVYPAAFLPAVATAPVIAVSQGAVKLAPAEHHHVVNANLDEFCRRMADCLQR